ncbi:DNA-3-methyladenine glycosylase [Nocardioides cavernaquae]|uniref:Putative 3-methyladenine DNA glycosylase n=1 Tax=Nocardioides cavernaquae TaxID=2321396 RepID=A0A3A5H9I8_9ACTN|nr:DNA-3-methyladenine glycosylase [Nocardioides cavernaquae]RJS47309.1 DNA-3-methyladenine glycosylase [Nocardioides cavernaquae]
MTGSADFSSLERPVLEAAPLLLGALLRHDGVTVRITEVEAYGGADDPGSHAAGGLTPRSRVMFGPAGRLYVFLSYGTNFCANVVTGPEGSASAVLLRGGEVVDGLDVAKRRRGTKVEKELTRGPGKLCSALNIRLKENRADLSAGPVFLELGEPIDPELVSSGPRVGLTNGADLPWRFWITGDPTVSAYRPAKTARRS